jgi:hypothetical protein
MAIAPRKAKRSPAQVHAGQAFAAGGRAAQAASRAASIKKTGKPPPRSKAQKAAGKKFAAAGRAAQAAARVRKAGGRAVTPKARAAVAPELVLPGSGWPTGCNDIIPTCASVAVACHLQAATGLTMTDAEILKLHKLAGGDSGVTIEDVLEAMAAHWGTVGHGRVRLMSFFQADESFLLAGMVVGIKLPHAGHAVLSAPGGMISWGQYLPWEGEPEEAWALEWGI